MRLVLKIIFILILAGLLGKWVAPYWSQVQEKIEQITEGEKRDLEVKTSLCYCLEPGKTLSFDLPPWTDKLKVLSNAELKPQFSNATEAKWPYTLNYNLQTTKDNEALTGSYHHVTKRSLYKYEGKTRPALLFQDSQLIPADGRVIRLNLQGLTARGRAQRLDLSLEANSAHIQSVLVRVYVPKSPGEDEQETVWRRLPPKQRERLAEGNVYPRHFLTKQEKLNILSHRWQPLAPRGIEGQDYELKRLYSLQEKLIAVEEEPVLLQGVYAAPGSRFTFPVAEGGQKLRFAFTPVENASKEEDITFYWHGPGVDNSLQKQIDYSGKAIEHTEFFQGGLLEIIVPQPLMVRVFIAKEDKELTPEPLYLRTFEFTEQKPLVFEVSHVQSRPTPFRVDLRLPFKKRQALKSKVSYEFLDKKGQVVRSGKKEVPFTASLYDRVPGKRGEVRISDPVSWYFRLPDKVKALRLSADRSLLAMGYNRPPDLVKRTKVPDDYFRALEREPGGRTWFLLAPKNKRQLQKENRSLLLRIQYRPPEKNPLIAAGSYDWQAFRPEGDWSGQHILTRREEKDEMREETLASAFHRLNPGKEERLKFESAWGLKSIRPSLIYVCDQKINADFNVFLDGKKFFSGRFLARVGEIKLPALATDWHKLRIETSADVQLYINSVSSQNAGYLLRFANKLGNKKLRFVYPKETQGEETLSLRYFAPWPSKSRESIEVIMRKKNLPLWGPYPGLTISKRRYIVRAQDKRVPILHAQDKFVDNGRTFFFPLAQDMPPGKYSFSISAGQDVEGYVQMYRVLPGRFERQRIQQEPYASN